MPILNALLSTTAIATPLIVLLLLLTPLLDKWYSARGRYWLWMLLLCGLCLPLLAFVSRPQVRFDVPVAVPTAIRDNIDPAPVELSLSEQTQQTLPSTEPASDTNPRALLPTMNTAAWVLIIWLTGVLLSLGIHAVSYWRLNRYIKRWSITPDDATLRNRFDEMRAALHIHKPIHLRICKNIRSPFLIGYGVPMLLLPTEPMDDTDLLYIFRHELTHYRRKDLWVKLALAFVRSLHWFNPAVHLLAAQMNKDMEAICDTLTVSSLALSERKVYSEIILHMAAGHNIFRGTLTTSFASGKRALRKRFENILGDGKRNGSVLFVMLGIVILLSLFFVACHFVPTTELEPTDTQHPVPSAPSAANEAPVIPDTDDSRFGIDTFVSGILDSVAGITNTALSVMDASLANVDIPLYPEAIITEHSYTGISSLAISTSRDAVKISTGGEALLLRYSEWTEDQYTLSVENGLLQLTESTVTLHLDEADKGNILNTGIGAILQAKGKPAGMIEIVIPTAWLLDAVSVSTTNGAITIDNGNLANLAVNTTNGTINMTDCTLRGTAAANSTNGAIQVSRGIFDTLAIATTNGGIHVADCTFGRLDISSTSGSGALQLRQSIGEYNLLLRSVSGGITYNGMPLKSSDMIDGQKPTVNLSSVSGTFTIND